MRSLPLLSLLLVALLLAACPQKETLDPQDDFWQTADPTDHNFDQAVLDSAIQAARDLPNFYALLVVRDGKLVVEEYFKGKDASDHFHLRSITKNVTSALAGIALEQGLFDSLDMSVQTYFPSLLSGDKSAITLRHLLNMASGLEWNENDEIIPLIEHKMPDPIPTLLARDLSDTPGSTFNYNSLSPHIVAELISRESGKSYRNYAESQLFQPLGIQTVGWTRDPQDKVWGGFGLQLRARDLARFGLLYLNQGQWQGQTLLPVTWVDSSQSIQMPFSDPRTGYSQQWWISRRTDPTLFYGQGYGGQGLMLLPSKNMLVVAFQEYLVDFPVAGKQWGDFIEQVYVRVWRAAK